MAFFFQILSLMEFLKYVIFKMKIEGKLSFMISEMNFL